MDRLLTKILILGWINDFLCWGGFIPLSRISYIIYLMHFTVIWTFESVMIYPLDGTNTMMVIFFHEQENPFNRINPFFADYFFPGSAILYHGGIGCHLCLHRNALASLRKITIRLHSRKPQRGQEKLI